MGLHKFFNINEAGAGEVEGIKINITIEMKVECQEKAIATPIGGSIPAVFRGDQ